MDHTPRPDRAAMLHPVVSISAVLQGLFFYFFRLSIFLELYKSTARNANLYIQVLSNGRVDHKANPKGCS